MSIYKNKNLRRLVIPLLKFFNPGKISIKHHYTGKKIWLDAFHHKGYWFHGKNRESDTMILFKKLIKTDFTILEIGGHIGYITNYFSYLVPNGVVYVFEPGINNLPFLKQNIENLENVTLVQKAVSNKNGKAKFYIENLTGQNNSLLSDYENFNQNNQLAFVKTNKKEVEVETITIDSFCQEFSIIPDFIKVDIEGAELLALQGMVETLNYKPLMMIEITENWELIYGILSKAGYKIFNEKKVELKVENHHSGNVFCIPLHKEEFFIA
ncbi:MAG: FkbM family methyltransferase [Ferruginibacter sp.]